VICEALFTLWITLWQWYAINGDTAFTDTSDLFQDYKLSDLKQKSTAQRAVLSMIKLELTSYKRMPPSISTTRPVKKSFSIIY